MKKFALLGIATLLFGLLSTGCIDPLVQTDVGTRDDATLKTMEFKASLEQNEDVSETALDGLRAVWNDGDMIKIFNAEHPSGEFFVLKAGDGGKKSGIFEGPDIGPGPYYAIYPADMEYMFVPDNNQFLCGIPRVQYYSPGSFGRSAIVSWAQSETQDDLVFHNASGAVSFCLKGTATIVAINLYTCGDEMLSSGMDLFPSTKSSKMYDKGKVEDCGSLILDCSRDGGVELNEDDGVTFSLTVPDGAFSDGLFVEFVDSRGMAMTLNAKGSVVNPIDPSQIVDIIPVIYDHKYNAAFLRESDDFAAYSNVSDKVAKKCCTYTDGVSQYAFYNSVNATAGKRYVRFQDWSDGYSLALTISKIHRSKTPLTLVTDETVAVKVEALGETGTIVSKENASMKVIKKTASHAWLYDSNTDDGFVIKLED